MTSTSVPLDSADGFQSQLWKHLATYSVVDYAYNTTQSYYKRVKSANSYLEYGLEKAEYLTATAVKTAEPLLAPVDSFGYRQFVKVEDTLSAYAQVPFNVLDKALDVGEGSLDYWLPVEKQADNKDTQKDKADPSLHEIRSRAFHILDAFQLRAKTKLYDVVSTPVEFANTKVKQVKQLTEKVASLPSTVSHYYTERKTELVARVSAAYSYISQPLHTATELAFELFYSAKLRYESLRSSTLQELGISFVNSIHQISQFLLDRFYPARLIATLQQHASALFTQLAKKNPFTKHTNDLKDRRVDNQKNGNDHERHSEEEDHEDSINSSD